MLFTCPANSVRVSALLSHREGKVVSAKGERDVGKGRIALHEDELHPSRVVHAIDLVGDTEGRGRETYASCGKDEFPKPEPSSAVLRCL